MVKLLAGLALLLPGFFWWVWCGDREKDPGEALAGILGVSAAFIALIALFFYTIRVSITPPIFGLLLVLFLLGRWLVSFVSMALASMHAGSRHWLDLAWCAFGA